MAQTFEVLKSFDSSEGCPWAGLVQGADGNLYGTTSDCDGGEVGENVLGTIFKIDTSGSTFTILHSFAGGSEGQNPEAPLIQASDGYLYGATLRGGGGGCPEGCGTIFKIDTTGSTFTTLYSFATGSDGRNPVAGLIQGTDGNLYGTAAFGARGAEFPHTGTVFKIDTSGSTFTILHSFSGGSEGQNPEAPLIQASDGYLYGATLRGGGGGCPEGCGTIFKIDTSGSTFTTLHSFDYHTDGAYPYGGLMQGSDGNLYGTTFYGAGDDIGTIFKIDTEGTTFETLYHFTFIDGSNPRGCLIQDADGSLYGTTVVGGPNFDHGTIFKIDPDGSILTTLHNFAGADGAWPYGGVIKASDGYLYGTTLVGGANGAGVIFRLGLSLRRPSVPPRPRNAPRVVDFRP